MQLEIVKLLVTAVGRTRLFPPTFYIYWHVFLNPGTLVSFLHQFVDSVANFWSNPTVLVERCYLSVWSPKVLLEDFGLVRGFLMRSSGDPNACIS